MIITKIQGGLGNQMFQYAVGRHLALKNNTELKFDGSFYDTINTDTPRFFAINKFNIVGDFMSNEQLQKIKRSNLQERTLINRIVGKILKTIEAIKPIRWRRFVGFQDIVFYPEVLKIKTQKTVYLAGNWPTHKYFEDIADVIQKDFTLKEKMSTAAEEISNKIKKTTAVSMHIRRGDYVNNEKTKALHDVCSLEYYNQAMKKIKETVSGQTYFIFSDDIAWVKENLKTDSPILYVSDQNIPDYEELILMSQCQHNIIANSTFSWWGAWLNSNPNKIVISPKKWFNDPSVNIKDLVPEKWIKI